MVTAEVEYEVSIRDVRVRDVVFSVWRVSGFAGRYCFTDGAMGMSGNRSRKRHSPYIDWQGVHADALQRRCVCFVETERLSEG